MEFGMTMGGLLTTYQPLFPYTASFFTVLGGTWAFGMFAANISAFIGDESKDVREYRQWIGLVNWLGWTVSFAKYLLVDNEQGGLMGGSFNYVWLLQFFFFAILHLMWVMEGDLAKKMKIA